MSEDIKTGARAIYLARACELALRGVGSTSPNPCVGAVIVRGETTLGEGYHRVRGAPHAEVEALHEARARGHDVRGATLYVSLEPCNHHGATPPCTDAIIDAGVKRVIIGASDPNPKTNGKGLERLRDAGVDVAVVADPWSQRIIESFAVAIRTARPYVTLKMAASLDGYVAPQPGRHWLTGEAVRERVRELRIAHDAVMVGAGTVRVDDPQLTVRPAYGRRRPYVRIVVCEDAPVPPGARIFKAEPGYARTIVVAPGGVRDRFASLERVADCIFAGDGERLDLSAALIALKEAGIASVLCEGGPTFAAGLLAQRLVDRLIWIVAPVLLAGEEAVPALARGADVALRGWHFEIVERTGEDLWLVAKLPSDV
ncbi:MAG: bifunctional diaminohydroxyphosphoribosylaminopyrimidine deaminase/5-amino-6-(5-phosphoribosylamino)uracil reductase RibD [Vulcanimicrobiaceae bacterium]